MPNSIFDPKYNPFTVDQGTIKRPEIVSKLLKKKHDEKEQERLERQKLEKIVPGGFDNA